MNASVSDTVPEAGCIQWLIAHPSTESVMNTASKRIHSIRRSGSLCAISAVLSVCAAAAMAVANTPSAEIQARYEQERATCLNGTSNQDRATCLKEAGAARDEARKGQLNDGDAKYHRNAKVRCEALAGDEARDCLARMKGKGTTSGSVEAGGILRETVTREVKPVDAPASEAPAR